MSVATAERRMAKRNDISVKIDVGVLADCRIAAAFKGVTVAEYISEKMRLAAKQDIEEGYASRSEAFPVKREKRPSKPKA